MPSVRVNKRRVRPVSLYKYFFFHIIAFANGEEIRMERTSNIKNHNNLWTSLSFLSLLQEYIFLKSHNLKSNITNIILSLILVNTWKHYELSIILWAQLCDCWGRTSPVPLFFPQGAIENFRIGEEYKNNSLPKIICHYKWGSVTRIVNTFFYL